MLNIVWILVALKIAGLTTLAWPNILLLFIVLWVMNAVLLLIKNWVNQKRLISDMDTFKDVQDDESVVSMLGLILRKLYIK